MKNAWAIHQFLNQLIRRSRGDDSYNLDEEISPVSVGAVMMQKSLAMGRGYLHGPSFRRCAYPLFVGSKVIIRNPRHLSVGKSIVIDDYACIDALSRDGVTIGDGTTIEKHAFIKVTGVLRKLGEGLRIGRNCSIGAFSYLGAAGGINIGDNVLIGQRVSLHAENHVFEDRDRPIRDQGVTRKGIKIGNDCWVGSGTIILDGVTIGAGCVVGAGSVVSANLPPYSVAMGIPAKVIRERGVTK